jgi:hypothetical protein
MWLFSLTTPLIAMSRRSVMIGGWTAPISVTEAPSPVTSKEALGRIVDVRRQGNMELSITIQTDDGTVLCVTLDGIKYPSIHMWMTIGGARKLLVPGVPLLCHHEKQLSSNNDTIEASHITIHGALPATPCLAQLLSYSFATLNLLFPSTITTTTSYPLQLPLGLAVVLGQYNNLKLLFSCAKKSRQKETFTLYSNTVTYYDWHNKYEKDRDCCARQGPFHPLLPLHGPLS